MSWYVRGSFKKPNHPEATVFEHKAQYVADVQKELNRLVQAGCTEIFIVKRGERDARGSESETDYHARIRDNFAVDSGVVKA
jgi:hypothetical protein